MNDPIVAVNGDIRTNAQPVASLVVSREALLDGSFTARARAAAANAGVEMFVRPDEEVESTRVEFLAQRPKRKRPLGIRLWDR